MRLSANPIGAPVIALIIACALAFIALVRPAFAQPVTLIIHNADIWTVDEARPRAQAVAVAGERIVLVGSNQDALALREPGTRVLNARGAFMLPGFIDAHTHFGSAVDGFFKLRLIDVDDQAELNARLQEAVDRVPPGTWLTGAQWGGLAASAAARRGEAFQAFTPSLAEIDRIAPDHPVLIRRYDGAYFVNSRGLALARIDNHTPDPLNGAYVRDAAGELTGLLLGTAGERMEALLPPPTLARDYPAARAVLHELNGYGLTGIHDFVRLNEVSQERTPATYVERSFTDIDIFRELNRRGDLTLRVFAIPTAAYWDAYAAHGLAPGAGDDMIRFGALKVFVDGYMMEEPFGNHSHYAGGFSFRVVSAEQMRADIIGADALGWDIAAHVTGDRGHRLLTDWFEQAAALNPERDRRLRYVHAWYPARSEIERAGRLGAIADVQPYHLIRELDGMTERLGPARASFAFPWRTMIEHGVRINLSSDWPGSFDGRHLAAINPLEIMYHAIARSDLDGTPRGGWLPEQGLTIDEAIRAYTINPAYAAREEALKGSISEGKLADFVLLSRNIRRGNARDLLRTRVLYTFLGGRIIYQREAAR